MSEPEIWRRCSACKDPIPLGATYWACNVSTCNRKRTALMFCSVTCWEVHLPGANHREAWAEERTAPDTPDPTPDEAAKPSAAPEKKRRIVTETPRPSTSEPPREILIVASRLKEYVRAKSGYNTSERVLGPLSDIVRRAVDEAIRNAQREERRTVLDRDVPND